MTKTPALPRSGWELLGATDLIEQCDCCGRSGLTQTVAMFHEDHGTMHFGTGCAATLRGMSRSSGAKLAALAWGLAVQSIDAALSWGSETVLSRTASGRPSLLEFKGGRLPDGMTVRYEVGGASIEAGAPKSDGWLHIHGALAVKGWNSMVIRAA